MGELDQTVRAVLAAAAFAAFACAFVTTPAAVRSANGIATASTAPTSPTAVPSAFTLVLPRRDPFTGDPMSGAVPQPATATAAIPPASAVRVNASLAPMPEVPPLLGSPWATAPSPIGPLPPNAGAPTAGTAFGAFALPAQRLRVTAVVTGAHPWALVDDAGTTRLVTVGDRAAGDRVAQIHANGIRLADGRTIVLTPPATPPTPAIQNMPVSHGPAIPNAPAVRGTSPAPAVPILRTVPGAP